MTSMAEILARRGINVPAQQSPAPPAQAVKREMVLIVDDDDGMRNSLLVVLQSSYQMLGAANGPEAIKLHSENKDELRAVVMDAKMPGMDGFETSQALRAVNPDLPIIMLTAYQDMKSISEIVDHHFSAYVIKGDVRVGPTGEVEFGTMPLLKMKLATAVSAYSEFVNARLSGAPEIRGG